MPICPTCSTECPDGSRFCLGCGSPLTLRRPLCVERRIVTTLFCDLVGFTSLCETADPEDVDAFLRAYYSSGRRVIETYGGVVEKFVGDAVLAVFGLGVAHEDDPERAVRAGLRLVQEVEKLPPVADRPRRVRIGITTGEALVRADVDPHSGEGFLVGDAVNTAARLQALATPMSVVVDAATKAATDRAISYEELAPTTVRGKSAELRSWVARGAVSLTGVDDSGRFSTPLVGREVELGILKGLVDKVASTGSPQVAFIIGEPGVGKSRLVHELSKWIDANPDLLVTWRQGTCPAYGDGIAFWGLGEIVKAQAGIVDSDAPSVAHGKLRRMVGDDVDARWLLERLQPLVGLPSPQVSRQENFTAWQSFLEGLASTRPTVIVLEDLHSASEATLAFVDHLAHNLGHVPLLLLATARSALLDDRTEFIARQTELSKTSGRVFRLDVANLAPPEGRRLVESITDRDDLLETTAGIVARSGGNPLFIQELVRLLEERAVTDPHTIAREAEEALPGTLQAVISARLDLLKPSPKALLKSAAVFGEVFWDGGVAALDGRSIEEAHTDLQQLIESGLVRQSEHPSLEGQREYVFWHGLSRDVAYRQMPRNERAGKHERAAVWLEAVGGGRDDDADLLAHHCVAALDLYRALGDDGGCERVRARAVLNLKISGDRAMALDVADAERAYARALAEAPADLEGHAQLVLAWANAMTQAGRFEAAVPAFEDAVRDSRRSGDHRTAAIALMQCASALYWRDGTTAGHLREQALSELAGEGDCAELASLYEESAVQFSREYLSGPAIGNADRALLLCRRLGLPEPVRALSYRGASRSELGDQGGLADLRRARRVARRNRLGLEVDVASYLLADALYPWKGPLAALIARREGLASAAHRGDEMAVRWFKEGEIQDLLCLGRWDDAERACDELEPELVSGDSSYDVWELRALRAHLLVNRGELTRAAPLASWCVEHGGGNPGNLLTARTLLAAAHLGRGQAAASEALLREVEETSRDKRGALTLALVLPLAVRLCGDMDRADLAERLLEGPCRERPLEALVRAGHHAHRKEKDGDLGGAATAYRDAAEGWRRFGVPWEEALARFGQARCQSETDEAASSRRRAWRIVRRLRAEAAVKPTRMCSADPARDATAGRG